MDAITWDVLRVTAIEPSTIDVHNLTVAGQPRGWFARHLTASWLVRPPLDHHWVASWIVRQQVRGGVHLEWPKAVRGQHEGWQQVHLAAGGQSQSRVVVQEIRARC